MNEITTGSIGRVEAFSDGVLAIIVTIMVLELKAPEEHGIAHILQLWPTFLAYVLSYAYVAIYWINHHRLFSHARVVSNGLLWSNMALLFSLSLVPFATAYLGEHHFTRDATLIYLLSLLLPGLAYDWLHRVIRTLGGHGIARARRPCCSMPAASRSPLCRHGLAWAVPRWWRCSGFCLGGRLIGCLSQGTRRARRTNTEGRPCAGKQGEGGRPRPPPFRCYAADCERVFHRE